MPDETTYQVPRDVHEHTLYHNLMTWVSDHCEDHIDYAYALKWCGFTREEIIDELDECGIEIDAIHEALKEIGMAGIETEDSKITIDLEILERDLKPYTNAFGLISIQEKRLGELIEASKVDR